MHRRGLEGDGHVIRCARTLHPLTHWEARLPSGLLPSCDHAAVSAGERERESNNPTPVQSTMATHRDSKFPSKPYVDPTPLPSAIPEVREIGTSSAPLKSASFFIGEACKSYNEDFMLCKNESADPEHCLKEGRRVTRCAQDLIRKLGDSCGKQWEEHWACLEHNNQEFYKCRQPERTLNKCVFDKLNLAKKIPGTAEGKEQVHELKRPVWR